MPRMSRWTTLAAAGCQLLLASHAVLEATEVTHPVLAPQHAKRDVPSLTKAVEPVMRMTEQQLYELVPACSGIYFCGCPNCNAGSQEHEIGWSLAEPNIVRCRYCKMVMPNEKYPAHKKVEIVAPSGARQVYRYHESPDGRQFFFEARGWYGRWQLLNQMGWLLGDLYALTRKQEYADRAAIIIGRFAQVFPDYAIRYDYPYRPVRFWPADTKSPVKGFTPYRAAKYYWWAYGDVPEKLIRAYDQIAGSGAFKRQADLLGQDIRRWIEDEFFRAAVRWVMGHPDRYGNMSPGMYADFIVAGRVLGEPGYVHEAVRRAGELMKRQFFFDGWWREGTPSYHSQTIGNMANVARVAKGYSDPANYQPPAGQERLVDLDLKKAIPMIARALAVSDEYLLPNGRLIPINDTWWFGKRGPLKANRSRLWSGLGHAVLAAGTGRTAFQVHLNWSGGYGHTHFDNGSIILFAHGKELLSDIGYTHTKYRNWTINSASHNLVVVDERSQQHGELVEDLTSVENAPKPSDGNLLLMDVGGPVQVVEVDAQPAYNGRCKTYRRMLIHVHPDEGQDCVVDIFDVAGGEVHDYFLHGCADEDGTLELSIPCERKVETLVPSWGGRGIYTGEGDCDTDGKRFHAYGFLHDISTTRAEVPFVAAFGVKGVGVGLRAHVVPVGGFEVFKARSPSIRRARNEDARLDDYWMPTLVLRRRGKDLVSRFVTVLESTRGKGSILAARKVTSNPATLVLEIVHTNRTEWLVINKDHRTTWQVQWPDRTLAVTGRVGIVSLSGSECRWAHLLDGTVLTYTDVELKGAGPWSGSLIRAGGDQPSELVTDVEPPNGKVLAGRVAVVRHGNGRTHGYVIKRVNPHPGGSVIVVEGDCGFDYDAASQQTTFRYFPRWRIRGPSQVTVPDVVSWQAGASQ